MGLTVAPDQRRLFYSAAQGDSGEGLVLFDFEFASGSPR
jgi:hypothetical protein